MFAGTGDFFRPVNLRRDIAPAAGVPAAARSGEEQGKPPFAAPPPVPADDAPAEPPAADATFAPDSLELTVAALQSLLSGRVPDEPAAATPAAAVPAALLAYQRAAAAAPLPVGPVGEGMRTELSERARSAPAAATESAAGADIFYMLAALEKAGVRSIRVAEGYTIYDALRQQCRALDIALAAPVQRPDNPRGGL